MSAETNLKKLDELRAQALRLISVIQNISANEKHP